MNSVRVTQRKESPFVAQYFVLFASYRSGSALERGRYINAQTLKPECFVCCGFICNKLCHPSTFNVVKITVRISFNFVGFYGWQIAFKAKVDF